MRFRRRYEVVVQGESGSATSQYSVISEHRNERDAREAAALERRRLEMIRAEEAASWVISVMRGDERIHEERPFGGRRDAVPVPPVGRGGATRRGPGDPPAPQPAPDAEAAPEPEAETSSEAADDSAGAPGDGHADADAATEAEPTEGAQTGTIPAVTASPAPTEAPTEAPPESEAAVGASDPEPAGRAHAAFTVPQDIAEPDEKDAVPPFLAESRAGDTPSPEPGGGETGRTARTPRDTDIPSGPVPEDVIRRFEEAIARESDRKRERDSRS
jgi:hypothetical protein